MPCAKGWATGKAAALLQSGETAAALAANYRLAADIAVDTGFALVPAAPDGETGLRLCQGFLEVEVCTIVFE